MNLFLATIQGNSALISDAEAHHLKKVLRKTVGDTILVSDGNGNIFTGKIAAIQSKNVLVDNIEVFENKQKRNYWIEMAIAPTKQIDRTEFFLEKAIEIGLDAVHPMITFHSERRKINQERFERVGIAAMKQSLKAELLQINHLINLNDLIKNYKNFEGQKFIAHCYNDIPKTPLKKVIELNQKYLFLIGPEGDFSKEEVNLAIENNFTPITLGNQRMRTETAALACVTGVHWLHQ